MLRVRLLAVTRLALCSSTSILKCGACLVDRSRRTLYWNCWPQRIARGRTHAMEVDPPPVSTTEPSAAPSPSLKRPQENASDKAAAASKRPKNNELTPEESGSVNTAQGEPGEGETTGTKAKGDKRGDGKKKQKGKKGKDKDKEYVRSRRRGTRPEGEDAPAPENGESKPPRLPKRLCALLIGFCGDGYNGMQMCVSLSYTVLLASQHKDNTPQSTRPEVTHD